MLALTMSCSSHVRAIAVRPASAGLALALAISSLSLSSSCASLDSWPKREVDGLSTTTIAPVGFDAVYVVNGESSSISVIDAESNAVAGTIEIRGAIYPHHIALSADRALLGIAVPGYDMSGGEYGHSHHSSRAGSVVLLDALTGALRASTRTNAANNNAVFGPEGQIWTSQATQPGSTLVLSTSSLEITDAISVGASPAETVMSNDGSLVFVANSGSASISVIDVAARRVKATINVGAGPVLALPSTDGLVYVENEPDQTVSVIDRNTLGVARTFSIGYVPGSIATPGENELWITSPERGSVEIRDSFGKTMHTIPTGAGAHWVVFSADHGRAFVSNELANTVSVVDRRSMSVTATIAVGAKPNGMVWRSR